MKSAVKRSVGSHALTQIKLKTVLDEVEACVNSRPLTFVGGDLSSESPLTPSHFLIGRSPDSKASVSDRFFPDSSPGLVSRNQVWSEMLNSFWFIWSTDYICGIPLPRRLKEIFNWVL